MVLRPSRFVFSALLANAATAHYVPYTHTEQDLQNVKNLITRIYEERGDHPQLSAEVIAMLANRYGIPINDEVKAALSNARARLNRGYER